MKPLNFYLRLIYLLISAVVMTSCAGLLYTSIDIIKPAKVTFPQDVNNILILNNSTPQPHNYGHLTEFFNEKIRKVSIDTDSLPLFNIATLTEKIAEKGFFNSVVVDPVSTNQNEFFFTPTTPDDTQINKLARKYQVEGIVSLNRLLVTDQLAELYNQENNSFIAFIEAKYETQWTVHFPGKKQTIPVIIKDTVYWESESYSRQKAQSNLPNRRDALIDGALIAGERAVNSFIPYWVKEDRYFFDSKNKKFRAGIDSVYVKNWDGAAMTWTKLYESTSNIYLKVKAAHNLAVVHEIKGDVKKAREYSQKASENLLSLFMFDYKNFVIILNYNDILRKRVAESEKLTKQLGE